MKRLQQTLRSRRAGHIIQGEAGIMLRTHHSLRLSSPDSSYLSSREELPSCWYSPNSILAHSVYSRLAYGNCISYLGRRTYLMLNCSIWNHGRISSFQYEYLNSGRFCWHKMIQFWQTKTFLNEICISTEIWNGEIYDLCVTLLT